jgi:hypothetical protein
MIHFDQTRYIELLKKQVRENNKVPKTLKKDLKRLSTFSIDSKADEFSYLINEIFEGCDTLEFDFD